MRNTILLVGAALLLVVAIYGIVSPSYCMAQMFKIVGFSIHNVSNQSVNISVRGDRHRWESYSMSPDSVREFPCPWYKYAMVRTRTDSGTKVAHYRMECARRYTLRYNDSEGKWDFFLASD